MLILYQTGYNGVLKLFKVSVRSWRKQVLVDRKLMRDNLEKGLVLYSGNFENNNNVNK